MRKMMFMAMMMTIAISANAMTYNEARSEALFLSDKMAYELGLTNEQYEAVYEINLDYLLNVNNRADVLGPWWDVRNRDLRYVLSSWQLDRYLRSAYFYRPLVWNAGRWSLPIYGRYTRGRMFMHRPAVFVGFRGGHSHRNASFYARHQFRHPAAPVGRGHHPSANPGRRNNHHGYSTYGNGHGHHGSGYGNRHNNHGNYGYRR